MKENNDRRKVLIVSVLVFLITGGGVFTFFVFQGLEDLKDKPGFAFEYDSFQKKALLPMLKYLGVVDTEVVSSASKSADVPGDRQKVDELFGDTSGSQGDASAEASKAGSSKNPGGKRVSSSGPSSKLASSVSGPGSFAGGGTQTGAGLTSFGKGGASKGARVGETLDSKYDSNGKTKNLFARLEATRDTIQEGLKSNSATQARYKWEQSFSGNAGGNKMSYSDGALKLDKSNASVSDLKLAENKGLTAPEPDKPTVDNDKNDPLAQKAQDAAKDMMQDLQKGMMNSMLSGIGGSMNSSDSGNSNSGNSGDLRSNPDGGVNPDIKNSIDQWKFSDDEYYGTSYFPEGGGYYKAYFPDGFVLKLDSSGNPMDYYYVKP